MVSGREAVMSHEVKRSLLAAQRGARTLQKAGKMVQSRMNSEEIDELGVSCYFAFGGVLMGEDGADGVDDVAAAVLERHREHRHSDMSHMSLESVEPMASIEPARGSPVRGAGVCGGEG